MTIFLVLNKKVIKRDRKRTYCCRGASTHYSVLCVWGGRGYPSSRWGVLQSQLWGYTSPSQGDTPVSAKVSFSPAETGVSPTSPKERTWDQRPGKEPGTGVPSAPPPPRGQTDWCLWKHYLPLVLRTRVVNISNHIVNIQFIWEAQAVYK